MAQRLFASILLLFSVLFLPIWISALLAILLIFYFDIYWEAVVIFLLSDLLYGAPETLFFDFPFFTFVFSVVFLVLLEFVKKKLKFYR